ncbi:hypothetical protein LQZ19_14815 [Treponema primitia]|uniref:hypothetical protein n=1 Tax=Treponema primitia TaxID=88058 RepID=UPI00397F4730
MQKRTLFVSDSISYTGYAYHKGLEQGRKEGFAEGREEGLIIAYTALDDEFQIKLRYMAEQLQHYGLNEEQIMSITGLYDD